MASASRSPTPPDSIAELTKARARYRYLPRERNHMDPICVAESFHWQKERYTASWIIRFLPTYLGAQANHLRQRVRCALQKVLFRYDQLDSYADLFSQDLPDFARDFGETRDEDHDDAFAWWRIAGANALSLRRESNLRALCARTPLPLEQIQTRLRRRWGRPVSLEEEAREGRLFTADFGLIQAAIQWDEPPDTHRDSRWRGKYLPTPIAVFLADPTTRSGLLPVSIQIDSRPKAWDYNPVYTPENGWGWRIAKAYFEAADVTFQSGFGHVFRTHLLMEPFCMATPRQLPPEHPVRLLLEPHTRFTLTTNKAGYKYLIDRRKLYNVVYAAPLDLLREIAIQGYLKHSFRDLGLQADLKRRGVEDTPASYPYRDDMRLWLDAIRQFVDAYVTAHYRDDAAVQGDHWLQAWKDELSDPTRGAVRDLVPDGRLDTREKLANLLAQVLFTAGPGHASQHYSADYLYRYTPVFPGAVYSPPPCRGTTLDVATWLAMLPPINVASDQFRSNTFTNFRYDRFGQYGRYRLGRESKAREPIARFQEALQKIERTIESRQDSRLYPYEFAQPSLVPNSINI